MLNHESSTALAEDTTEATSPTCTPNAEILLLCRVARSNRTAEKPMKLTPANKALDKLGTPLDDNRLAAWAMKT